MIKVGGADLEAPGWLEQLAVGVRAARPALVVHGGGRRISAWQERLGLSVEKLDGVRVTTPEVAEVAHMVLSGPTQADIVRAFRAHGVEAVGVSGAEGYLTVDLVDPTRLGRVGRVTDVDVGGLRRLLASGFTPVIAPPSADEHGKAVNVNADEAAAAVARALGAIELLFVSDVPGILRDGVALPFISADAVADLIERRVVTDGMVAKLAAALKAGVGRVRIGNLAMLADPDGGTLIAARAAVAAA